MLWVDAVGGVTVSGVLVSYNSQALAVLNGGSGSTALVASLDQAADLTAVQALLRAITFTHNSNAPQQDSRSIQFSLSDNANTTSSPVSRHVNVVAVNNAPVLDMNRTQSTWQERDGNLILDPAISLSDPDSDHFAGGSASLNLDSGSQIGDRLLLAAGDRLQLQDDLVLVDDKPVATYASGGHNQALQISWSAFATPALAQEVLRALAFLGSDDEPIDNSRQLTLSVSDDGEASASAQLGITVVAVNDAPQLSTGSPLSSWREGDGPQLLDAGLSITDRDSADFAGGVLQISLDPAGDSADLLRVVATSDLTINNETISYQGLVIANGNSTGQSLALSLLSACTPTSATALLRQLAFDNTDTTPGNDQRGISIRISDGDGASSDPLSYSLTVSEVNAAPVLTLVGDQISYVENADPEWLFAGLSASDNDHSDLGNGQINCQINNNARAGDRLRLVHEGIGIGEVGLSEDQVLYGGAAVGSVSGQDTSTIQISLNTGVSPDRAARIIRRLAYAHDTDYEIISIDCSGYTGSLADNDFTLTLHGDATFVSDMTLTATGTLNMDDGGTLTTGGQTLFNLTATRDPLVLGDDLTVAGAINVHNGDLTWNGRTVTLSGAAQSHELSYDGYDYTDPMPSLLRISGAGSSVLFSNDTNVPSFELLADCTLDREVSGQIRPGGTSGACNIAAGVTVTLTANAYLDLKREFTFSAGADSVITGADELRWRPLLTGEDVPASVPVFDVDVTLGVSSSYPDDATYSIPAGRAFGKNLFIEKGNDPLHLTFAGDVSIGQDLYLRNDENDTDTAYDMEVILTDAASISIGGDLIYDKNSGSGLTTWNLNSNTVDLSIDGSLLFSDTVSLTFSEDVTTASALIADLLLPVTGDTLSTTSFPDLAASVHVLTLAGTPLLCPGGSYSSAAINAGDPSGIGIADGTRITDAAGLTAASNNAASSIDLGPSTTTLGLTWNTGNNPKSWPLGTFTLDSTANTVDDSMDLAVRNSGDCSSRLRIACANSSPSTWTPGGSSGSNTFVLKANGGTAPGSPALAGSYPLTLGTSEQTLVGLLRSGALSDWQLFFHSPTAITIGAGAPQSITVTVTAEVPP